MSTPPPALSRAAKQYARHQEINGGRCNCTGCVTYRIEQGLADDADRQRRAQWDTLQPGHARGKTES